MRLRAVSVTTSGKARMLFNSVVFFVFFFVVYTVYWSLHQARYRLIWLLAASLFFYGYWNVWYLGHFALVVVVSYLLIRLILKERNSRNGRWILWLAVGLNIVNLAFFKYTSSLLLYLHAMTGWEKALLWNEELGLILPLAISFYTFQIIAYIVDVWRGEIEETSLLEFSLFIFFFPQLIAGPIMRHSDIFEQFYKPVLDERKMYTGILFVLSGIFKKVVLADQMAPLINPIWNAPAQYDSLSLILATVGFSIQIYCDFSGYTDIARGAAALIGFDIPENFTDPFFSTSFRDLWQKWHITLSTWIRDYLYIPLGGSRSGPVRSELNTVIAMSLAGLWHGTTYNYFLWGFLHGVLLVAERLVMGKRKLQSHVAKVIGYTVTMTGWLIGAVFFRSYDMTSASAFFKGIFSLSGERVDKVGTIVLIVVVAMIFQFFRVRSERFQAMVNRRPRTVVFTLTLLLFFVLTGLEIQSEQFIYFQF